jgi:hypothetical protein
MLPALPTTLLLSLSLVASPWPGGPPAQPPVEDAPPSTVAPASIAGRPSPFTPYATPSAPAPTPTFERASYRVAPSPEYSTTSIAQAPEPPANTIAYPRPYPEPRRYSPQRRNLLIAGLVITIASIPPAVLAIHGAVKLVQVRDRWIATPPGDVDQRDSLASDAIHYANVVTGTGIAAIVLSTAGLILIGLATRKKQRERPERTPNPTPLVLTMSIPGSGAN